MLTRSAAGSMAPDRGAWYAGFELGTSQAEVAWHKSVELAEIDWTKESVTYDDYLADFAGDYHDIGEDSEYEKCLDPNSYVDSQALGTRLLREQSCGILYPSVRQTGGGLRCMFPACARRKCSQERPL